MSKLSLGESYLVVKYVLAKGLKVAGHAVNGDISSLRNAFLPEEMAALPFHIESRLAHKQMLAAGLKPPN